MATCALKDSSSTSSDNHEVVEMQDLEGSNVLRAFTPYSLKLERTHLNSVTILFNIIITSMPLLPWMLDFICIGSVELQGKPSKRKLQKWTILAHSGIRTHDL